MSPLEAAQVAVRRLERHTDWKRLLDKQSSDMNPHLELQSESTRNE
jgi:hypothetical protein